MTIETPETSEATQVTEPRGRSGVGRRSIVVRGVVQGVGFRPHVARIAYALALAGRCRNDVSGVFIEVEGPSEHIAEFERRLIDQAPPMSRIDAVTCSDVPTNGETEFSIIASAGSSGERTLIPPDTAVCDDCLAELHEPADRRHRHPFITCTNCGPRLSITVDLPYDRPNTTLAGFPLCDACAREYSDPLDRRYHAQPIGCHDCGPTLWFTPTGSGSGSRSDSGGSIKTTRETGVATGDPTGHETSEPTRSATSEPTRSATGDPTGHVVSDPIRSATLTREGALAASVEVLASGGVLAVKGIGGYHLACDATDPAAVARLRERKQRPDRPFALLVADLEGANAIVHIAPDAEALLTSPQRPIVLLPSRTGEGVAQNVAPGLDELGVMLAYAPVHHLLLADLAARTGRAPVLVMTSGNSSGEPLCHRDDDALARLGPLADGILGHDRPIVVPVEDSVVAWSATTGEVPIRRSRGYAPIPLELAATTPPESTTRGTPATPAPVTVLAAGAELKNTVALAGGGRVFVSAHIGDLESLDSQRAHREATDQLLRFHRARPDVVVADRHPGYASRAWAQAYAAEFGVPLVEVQHHHAHLASLAAERGLLDEPLLGLVFDGTGYGCDSTVWGGELLLLRDGGTTADRLGHLGHIRLPGGDGGVRNPARTAVLALLDHDIDPTETPVWTELDSRERVFVQRAHEAGVATVATSSVGRLFDVVASVLGIRHRVSYEAQAAIELEAAARRWLRDHPEHVESVASDYSGPSGRSGHTGRAFASASRRLLRDAAPGVLDPEPLLRHLVTGVTQGRDQGELAAWFHVELGRRAASLAADAATGAGVHRVGLTGGVFVNRVLLHTTSEALRARGLTPVTHRAVPANDGGLSLGQAAVGIRSRQQTPTTGTMSNNDSRHG